MAGPYTNGYGSSTAPQRGYGTTSPFRHGSPEPRSRGRLYGGYNGSGADVSEKHDESGSSRPRGLGRQMDLERHGAGRRNHTSSRSRSRAPAGSAEQQIEDILHYTKRDWSAMAENECIPTQTALQLLDPSSLGLGDRYQEFYDANQQLQSALRAIVNEHYQGFNSSIGIYHQINASIQSSQARISELRQALVDSKTSLTSTKSEVASLVSASREFEASLDATHRIEQIQAVPETLEARISEKRFISAVESLQEGIKLLGTSQLDSLGVLADMKIYMKNQEHALADILIEELHNHLYLKSPYCEQRWSAYAKLYGQSDSLVNNESKARELYDFLDQLDTSEVLIDGSARNPEADSFNYIYIIVESLHKLGRLEYAVEEIDQRLPVELYRILDRSSGEIQQRYPSAGRMKENASAVPIDDTLRDRILGDLLGTLYAKFEAIAEAYRAFYEVTEGICRREHSYDTAKMTRSFRELWKLYQSEIRSLLHDYLATVPDSDRTGLGRAGEENVFRQQRDRSKKSTFRMDWLDSGESNSKADRDDVNNLWQKQVPGLNALTSVVKNDNDQTSSQKVDTSSSGHKLLVAPGVFNVMCLLPPSVLFLKRLKELVPSTSNIVISSLSSFLNDFLINVFHPQLEEALTEESSQSFLQLDSFQEDPQWTQHANKPVFKGTIAFFEVISKFCKMLASLTHDQLFTQLVIGAMNNYYDKCCTWYRAIITKAQSKPNANTMKISASLAWEGDLSDTVSRVREKGELVDQGLLLTETVQLVYVLFNNNNNLEGSDLLPDRKAQGSLCLMYTSMMWLAGCIAKLRHISPQATDQTGMEDDDTSKPHLKRSLTTALIHDRDPSGIAPTYLPLSEKTASLFDGIVDGFEQLADVILRTLHLELRCEIAQSFASCFRGSFIYSDVADAPNEDIVKMLADVLSFDEVVRSHLPQDEYRFITRGIGQATDAFFVQGAVQNMTSINANGSAHMQLNIQVLHHSLLVIEPGCNLPRSNALFSLFERGPDAIVAAAHGTYSDPATRFTKQEYVALLKLWYSERMESDRQEDAVRARQSLEEKLSQLDEVKDMKEGQAL